MKKNDVKQQIKDAFSQVEVPFELEKTQKKIEAIDPSSFKENKAKKTSPRIFVPLVPVFACGIILAIVLPLTLTPQSSFPSTNTSLPIQTTLDNKEISIFARQTLSLITFIDEENTSASLINIKRKRYEQSTYQSVAKDIDEYIDMIEQFESEDGFYYALVSSDFLEIEKGDLTYTIQYEEEIINENLQRFQGSLVYQGSSYPFQGRIEQNGQEKEIETSLLLPNGERIEVEQEVEQGENEYSYEFYAPNQNTPYKTLEYEREIEGMKGESSLEIQEGDIQTSCSFEYRGKEMGDRFFAQYEKENGKEEIETFCLIQKISDGHHYTFYEDEEESYPLYDIKLP